MRPNEEKYQILTTFMSNNYRVDKIPARPKLVSNNAALLLYMNYCLNTFQKVLTKPLKH